MDHEQIEPDEPVASEMYGDLLILRIRQTYLDNTTVGVIRQACDTMPPVTALDFRHVHFVNSGGLSALLKWTAAGRANGYKIVAINVSAHHQQMFKVAEISRFMPVVDEYDLIPAE